MSLFLVIALAHFLALLSPGPDFFLITRTSLSAGWKTASGACLGIALANGLFIVAAFVGFNALKPEHPLFVALQWTGSAYLLYLGVLFIRHAGETPLHQVQVSLGGLSTRHFRYSRWWKSLGMGFLSGMLNPKNALFYTSLAAMLTGPYASIQWKLVFGGWMFSVVLLWDLLVAVLIGHPMVLKRFSTLLPWLERLSGVLLILIAASVLFAAVGSGF